MPFLRLRRRCCSPIPLLQASGRPRPVGRPAPAPVRHRSRRPACTGCSPAPRVGAGRHGRWSSLGARLAGRRPVPAPAADHHRHRPRHLRQQPAPAARPRPAATTSSPSSADTLDDLFARLEASFDVAAALRRQRLPRAAHPADRRAGPAAGGPRRPGRRPPRRCARPARRCSRSGGQQERLIDALLTLASSEQGVEQREPFDLADGRRRRASPRRPRRSAAASRVDAALAPGAGRRRPAAWSRAWSPTWSTTPCATTSPAAGSRSRRGRRTAGPRLTVRNSGPVIPPDEVDRLFQPFQRLGAPALGHADGHGSAWPSCGPSPPPTARRSTPRPGPRAASTSRCASRP